MSKPEKCNEPLTPVSKIVLEVDAFPFKGLEISENWKKLDLIENRSNCSKCKKSRKYFCYTCYLAVPEVQNIVPVVKLPVQVDIIKHAREMDGKSTAVHAAVLAPEDVRIFTYPCIPDYDPQENVVLVFPNKEAVSVQEICETYFRKVRPLDKKRPCHENRHSIIHRVVFIDSTWNQSRGIFKDPRIKALPSVVLKARLSQFWRHQADSPRWYLATVEAIHQFMVELDEAQWRLNHRKSSECDLDLGPAVQSVCRQEESRVTVTGNDFDPDSSKLTTNSCERIEELLKDTKPQNCSQTCQENNNTEGICEKGLQKSCFVNNEQYIYKGKYDNLLFFFRFMYNKIHSLYDHDQLRSYKRRLE